jgi:hypothetical protein
MNLEEGGPRTEDRRFRSPALFSQDEQSIGMIIDLPNSRWRSKYNKRRLEPNQHRPDGTSLIESPSRMKV